MKWLIPLMMIAPALAARHPMKRQDPSSSAVSTEAAPTSGPTSAPVSSESSYSPTSTSSAVLTAPTAANGSYLACFPDSPEGVCGPGAFCNAYGHGLYGCLFYNDCRGPNNACPSTQTCTAYAPVYPFTGLNYACADANSPKPNVTDANVPVDSAGFPIPCDSTSPTANSSCPSNSYCDKGYGPNRYNGSTNFCIYHWDCRNPNAPCAAGEFCSPSIYGDYYTCSATNSSSMLSSSMSSSASMSMSSSSSLEGSSAISVGSTSTMSVSSSAMSGHSSVASSTMSSISASVLASVSKESSHPAPTLPAPGPAASGHPTSTSTTDNAQSTSETPVQSKHDVSPATSHASASPAASGTAPGSTGTGSTPSQGGSAPSSCGDLSDAASLTGIYNLLLQLKQELDSVKADIEAIKENLGA